MTARKVTSSMLSRIAHDPVRNHLFVEFASKGGASKCYRYDEVATQVVTDLLAAPSIGTHFAANIRNDYPCQPVGPDVFENAYAVLQTRITINWENIVPVIEFF